MRLAVHHLTIWILVSIVFILIAPFDIKATEYFRPDNWAEMSFGIGASILTLVGIITSIVVSNENNRRAEFVDDLEFVMDKLNEKARINPDRSLTRIYDNSIQKLSTIMNERSPLKYSDGIIGIISFYCFLSSAVAALENFSFKWIYGSFLIGVALLVGYVIYCVLEFIKIDMFSRIPPLKGNFTLQSVKINGQVLPFDSVSKELTIAIHNIIRRMEFGVNFEGKIRNGHFHAIIRYSNGESTHIPEPNTYLGTTFFADGKHLVILPDKRLDTGILQSNGPVELLFEVCRDISENPYFRLPEYGMWKPLKYCSIPEGYVVESVELRVYEDPLYKSSHKRREVDKITVRFEIS